MTLGLPLYGGEGGSGDYSAARYDRDDLDWMLYVLGVWERDGHDLLQRLKGSGEVGLEGVSLFSKPRIGLFRDGVECIPLGFYRL
ncbi:hypothetical protein DJ017_17500 [Phenylobacterium soli]|uniref:Uncharacterized protein n=1 Tax=Phenylobacterium soli TaxID=2170551 RepID=A0A328AAJ6_9CAUL|nr:hypothetical protein DJ017_17500 [Phenylobacterium soli]